MKYMREIVSYFSSKPAFSVIELKLFLKNRNAPRGYHKILVQNLLRSGRIHKISRGAYTFHEEVQYAGFSFRPFYYGLEDALSILGIWEQETNPVVITPRKVRNGVRQFEGRNYFIRRINRRMFFGFSYVKYNDFYIPVSNIEKTLIDFVYFKRKLPESVLGDIRNSINREKLESCLAEVRLPLKNAVMHILDAS